MTTAPNRPASRTHPALRTLLLGFALAWCCSACAQAPALNAAELLWLGDRIFENECNSRPECLTAWNAGEEFPSLGIGHFIWYRAGQQAPFAETFPELVAFMQARGAQVPAWVRANGVEQPWPDREAFLAASSGPELTELRAWLAQHTDLQTAFIISRFDGALKRMLDATPANERADIEAKFNAVAGAESPYGLYALIDYVHFKGEGTKDTERYAGEGWGLLQVLQGMPAKSATPLQDFVANARDVLARRVALAPVERNEQRWLNGWHARLQTYLPSPMNQ
ncbi:MAG: hypothetical protein SV422_10360 [Pseudomonadota bacterium]|nr:hypothetical protein [Pseudomonadota bacterium]